MGAMIPLDVIDQIGRHCPRSMSIYAICLGRMDSENKITFSRKEITEDLSESYCKFKNDLKALAREGLLEWHEMGNYLHVIIGNNSPPLGDNSPDVAI